MTGEIGPVWSAFGTSCPGLSLHGLKGTYRPAVLILCGQREAALLPWWEELTHVPGADWDNLSGPEVPDLNEASDLTRFSRLAYRLR